MRPCDCKDQQDVKNKLNEEGIWWNSEGITVCPNYVLLTMGHTTVKISMRRFKMFAKWYLEDQKKEDSDVIAGNGTCPGRTDFSTNGKCES
jgi:hypothetical protein